MYFPHVRDKSFYSQYFDAEISFTSRGIKFRRVKLSVSIIKNFEKFRAKGKWESVSPYATHQIHLVFGKIDSLPLKKEFPRMILVSLESFNTLSHAKKNRCIHIYDYLSLWANIKREVFSPSYLWTGTCILMSPSHSFVLLQILLAISKRSRQPHFVKTSISFAQSVNLSLTNRAWNI